MSYSCINRIWQKKKKNYLIGGNKPGHFRAWRQLTVDHAFDFAFSPSVVNVHYGYHVPLQTTKNNFNFDALFPARRAKRTFRGWNSYFTQCWKPLPLIFIEVNTKQLPTKWAEYPTPLLVLKLKISGKKKKKNFFLVFYNTQLSRRWRGQSLYQYKYGFSRSMFTELMGSSRNHVQNVKPFS